MKRKTLLLCLCISNLSFGQDNLQIAPIGDFKTKSGSIIQNCKIGYRTIGTLNKDKTNVILWPTWITGTSAEVLQVAPSLLDTTGIFLIIVDALGNGISSSPSNTASFPAITIHDMVGSQHQFLTNHLKINHLVGVVGVSMGGMQTFEWIVDYPGFMDKAIAIVATPKQSFYDILVWQTIEKILLRAKSEKEDMKIAMERVTDIETLHLYTPKYFATVHTPDSVNSFLKKAYSKETNADNYLSQILAVIDHDIYKCSSIGVTEIKSILKCKVLVVVATGDLLVNPLNAIEFAKTNNCELVEMDDDQGHLFPFFNPDKLKRTTSVFLQNAR